jgi:hypothetical protein
MARAYGRFTTNIWRDKKFCALTVAEQWAYFMLGIQPDITAAGVLSLTVKRWSGLAADATPDALSDVLSDLTAKRFLVVDNDTEELLVRAFVKWDGGINNDKRRPVVLEAAHAVASQQIRAVLAQELKDLGVSDALWHALPDSPSDAISPFDRVVVTEVGNYRNPQSLNLNPEGGAVHADAEPAPFCSKHPNGIDKPCGACADARRAHTVWLAVSVQRAEQAKRELAATVKSCPNQCINGWIEDADSNPVRKCNHQAA